MTNHNFDSVFVVIPAHNEESRISKVLSHTLDLGFSNIIVVNDASTDNTRDEVEGFEEVIILDHIINLGPGGATQTGIEYAVKQNAKYIATIDADYQHDPSDLINLYDKIESEDLDIVVGSRFLSNSNDIPFLRIIYNKVGNIISYFLTGIAMTDSQSGLKIIRTELAENIAIETNGFEFCMEIIKNARSQKAKIAEVPINVSYTAATTKKGQNLSSGFSMLSRLFSPFS